MRKQDYYNYDKLYSYNGTYNFLVGGRGLGKTYGAKVKAIKSSIVKGDEFIYLRRFKTEMGTARNTFFADIVGLFPEWDFRINGGRAERAPIETRDDKKRAWVTMGYFISLSTAQNQKSVAFPKVKLIIFDEFILENGTLRYLPDESTIFNNFYSTIDRYKDKTKVLFLANSVSIMNPYFLEYEIRPDQETEFVTKAGGFIVCHFADSDKFKSAVFQTKFGQFIQDSEYAKYAVGNTFSDNHEMLLARKDAKARYVFTLESKRGTFSVWSKPGGSEYFIQDRLPKSQIMFTLVPEKMDSDKTLITFSDRPLAYLRTAFRQGNVQFDKPTTRNAFIEIFKR